MRCSGFRSQWLALTSDHNDLAQGTILPINNLPFLSHWCPFWTTHLIPPIMSCMIQGHPTHIFHVTLGIASAFTARRTGTSSAVSHWNVLLNLFDGQPLTCLKTANTHFTHGYGITASDILPTVLIKCLASAHHDLTFPCNNSINCKKINK